MARLLAFEWDDREARVVVGSARGKGLVVEHAFSIELAAVGDKTATAAGDEAVAAENVGKRVQAALDSRGLGKLETLVAVGRASIELKHLTLPPSPAGDLPDMVRFQAHREFNALGDSWPLDFIHISGSASEPHNVLAAAISPQLVDHIQAVCRAMGVPPKRLVLRPCASASLLKREPHEPGAVRLMVDPMADEVDLTVLSGDTVVYLRTARLPGGVGAHDGVRLLLAEIRRTIAAVHNMLGERRVEAVYLCGRGDEAGGGEIEGESQLEPAKSGAMRQSLATQIERELQLSTHLFDPLAAVELDSRLRRNLPARRGRFAPLVGMLLDEVEQAEHAIDFLNPRRRPEAASRRRPLLIGAAAVAAIVSLVALGAWWYLISLDNEIEGLTKQANDLNQPVKLAAQTEKQAADVAAWQSGDVAWLDELALLSAKFPPPKDAMLTRFHVVTKSTGPEVELEGLTRTSDTIGDMEKQARSGRHVVVGKETHTDARSKKYSYSFKTTIGVKPGAKEDYLRAIPTPNKAVPNTAPKTAPKTERR